MISNPLTRFKSSVVSYPENQREAISKFRVNILAGDHLPPAKLSPFHVLDDLQQDFGGEGVVVAHPAAGHPVGWVRVERYAQFVVFDEMLKRGQFPTYITFQGIP